jgi:cyclic beta-1,2-glucan synthetase
MSTSAAESPVAGEVETSEVAASLFTSDRLLDHARALGSTHQVDLQLRARSQPLLTRLDTAAARLSAVYRELTAATDDSRLPSEDWIRDNFYVVSDQIRQVRTDLPQRYYLELPRLTAGPFEGYPRVYAIASELVAHSDNRIDVEGLRAFVTAYQETEPLRIGEIWAIAIMLRLALVERLCALADRVLQARVDRASAQAMVARLEQQASSRRGRLWRWRDEVELPESPTPPFVVELLRQLRDRPPSMAPAWAQLLEPLNAQGGADEMIRLEAQLEATMQVSIGNAITSMRMLSSLDWPTFFERVSHVERVLRDDPAGAYAQMDFATRDRYRQSVEQLARRSAHSEVTVARRACEMADQATADPHAEWRHHVGYYLISRGRFALETELEYRPHIGERLARFVFRHPVAGYLGLIGLLTALGIASLLINAARHGASVATLVLVALAVTIPLSELAVNLINRLVAAFVPPRPLPKLDYRHGVPERDRTLVVVPALVASPGKVEDLLRALEVRYLGNVDPHLHFALLGDFHDADTRTTADDDDIVEAARRAVGALNAAHGADRFLFLHRERRLNASTGRWMGWERKRGKIEELNRLVLGHADTSFVVQVGDTSVLPKCRYVITLDADTQLPPDTARRLVGTIAHPLNRPRFDPAVGRVTEGYGVLQPRVEISLPSASRSWFSRIMSGHVGWDPYTTAASDVYQDLCHEGSYVGKGIYEPRAFHDALEGKVPDNALLSHDLFEGFFARAGLVADVHLVDDFPSHYLTWAARLHRWVRGDWQIAGWLRPTVPAAGGGRTRNPLPLLARWKILDNLRRSLLAPSLVALLALGWTVLPGSAITWTLLSLLVLAFPAYLRLGESLNSRIRGVSLLQHLRSEQADLLATGRQALLTSCFLVHQSWLMLDAIGRTVWRLTVSRQHLLEWESASDAARRLTPDAPSVWRRLWMSPAFAIALGLLVLLNHPGRLVGALPLLVLWSLAPAIAYRTGLPRRRGPARVSAADRQRLRRVARQTWRYFDELATSEHHWLITDNYQADRKTPVVPRTSPTNIGLHLLAIVAARDLGYITVGDAVERLERLIGTLAKLPKYRGHLYNWIDTRTLAPLHPLYVSTVDSGNLMGCCLVTREALKELRHTAPLADANVLEALGDELGVVEEHVVAWADATDAELPVVRRFLRELDVMRQRLTAAPRALSGWLWLLHDLSERLTTLDVLLHEVEDVAPAAARLAPARSALGQAARLLERRRAEFRELAPRAGLDTSGGDEIPTLATLSTQAPDGGGPGPRRHGHEPVAPNRAADLAARAERLERQLDALMEATEFGFLFEPTRKLFSIGFNVTDGRLDSSHYDTLASEARLASFLAIATGQVPQEHWFRMSRTQAPVGAGRALLSWSASMFEYLMPLLVMRSDPGTLLHETCQTVVQEQIAYARGFGVPWGISESAYNARDMDGNYQYKAFGVPGLGLKRGLREDLVVAPYASLLAVTLEPQQVVANLDALDGAGLWGPYGYYDAVDYTGSRVPAGSKSAVVATAMAHHQGMTIVALDNCLNSQVMPRRFHRDPRITAVELLLHERVPALVPLVAPPAEQVSDIRTPRTSTVPVGRSYTTPHTAGPRAHLLSNGAYTVMVTNTGGGYSACRGLALTRWREDRTSEGWGQFCYLRDLRSGALWSATYQPTQVEPDDYEVVFGPDRAIIRRRDGTLDTHTEIAVSPEDDVEIRRVSITNRGTGIREIELTSYAEIVLGPQNADLAHPAFGNLFVETTLLPERDAIVCTRRPRGDEPRRYLIHLLASRGRVGAPVELETDRARFVGRLGDLVLPDALRTREPLSGASGAVLDPIVSIRQRVRLPAGATARVTFVTGYAETEEGARALIEKYHDRQAVARVIELADGHSQAELRHLNLDHRQATLIQRLASRLRFADPRLRAADAIAANRQSREALWKYGISGDVPILLVVIDKEGDHGVVRESLSAHEYCRLKGFAFDLVILNAFDGGYRQDVQDDVNALIDASPSATWRDKPGGVFTRRVDAFAPDDVTTLRALARGVLLTSRGSLAHQLEMPGHASIQASATDSTSASTWDESLPAATSPEPDAAAMLLGNGLGGFSPDGAVYRIVLDAHQATPAPWSNVIANPMFGCLVTEAGPRCTWVDNSQSRRLTSWTNDPVRDPAVEAVYLHDAATTRAWSLTPAPRPSGGRYIVRHTQGGTSWEHTADDWHTLTTVSVPDDAAVKCMIVCLENQAKTSRSATLTWYADLVLGDHRTNTAATIVTRVDTESGLLLADNAMSEHFGSGVAFMGSSESASVVSGDRAAFIGQNRALTHPRGLDGIGKGRVGAGLDPAGIVQTTVTLGPGESRDVVFVLGHAAGVEDARVLAARFRSPADARASLAQTLESWNHRLGRLQVRTPDPALDVMVNRWLLYQTLSCRLWGRTAFYQSSGAFGFRDQLQDVLALIVMEPGFARAQLLKAASRQFVEGDVQHWWHEPGGHGVRTRFSDDRLWMIYAAKHYIDATGDTGVLDEPVPFLHGRRLQPGEHEVYQPATASAESRPLYEHCARALDISLEGGAHGLPLIGTGDWNDGMNSVGEGGRGESVWLAWFQLALLPWMADQAELRGELARAQHYRERIRTLIAAADDAWDGAWYRRAYFDDGTPLGSSTNTECRIDAIAQAWAVLSGHANPDRAAMAMASADRWLVRRDSGLVLLLTPPFDHMVPSPGYIKGYVPGVRENGGQYTHAALWVALAFAELGDGARAGEILSMINPAQRAGDTEGMRRFRTEPYVVAADVYSEAPHVGRGGWTWYTGSASWMYRVIVEGLLGCQLRGGDALHIDPCIPPSWPGFELTLRGPNATELVVAVENPHGGTRGIARLELDGKTMAGPLVPLATDGARHHVRVVMAKPLREDAAKAADQSDALST